MRLSSLGLSTENSYRAVRYGLILLMLYAVIQRLIAGDLAELQVTESGGIYRIRMVMVVHAPARYVRGVLTDYAHIYRLNHYGCNSPLLAALKGLLQ
jgi:hypothetical protein